MDITLFGFWFSCTLLILVIIALIALSLRRIFYACKFSKVKNQITKIEESFDFDLDGENRAIHTPRPHDVTDASQ